MVRHSSASPPERSRTPQRRTRHAGRSQATVWATEGERSNSRDCGKPAPGSPMSPWRASLTKSMPTKLSNRVQSTSCTPRFSRMMAAIHAQAAPHSAAAIIAMRWSTQRPRSGIERHAGRSHAADCDLSFRADIDHTGPKAKRDADPGENVRRALVEREGDASRIPARP